MTRNSTKSHDDNFYLNPLSYRTASLIFRDLQCIPTTLNLCKAHIHIGYLVEIKMMLLVDVIQ